MTKSRDWHVSIPTDSLPKATAIFAGLDDVYKPWKPCGPQLRSLIHTYPRFKQKGLTFTFYLVPGDEYFISGFDETILERSTSDIPYPRLDVLVQSLIDTQRWADVEALIDGMDLSEQWGEQHLDLEDPDDAERAYIKTKNDRIMASCDDYPEVRPIYGTLSEEPREKKKQWRGLVSRKRHRIGLGDKHLYATQYRLKGSCDPRHDTKDIS